MNFFLISKVAFINFLRLRNLCMSLCTVHWNANYIQQGENTRGGGRVYQKEPPKQTKNHIMGATSKMYLIKNCPLNNCRKSYERLLSTSFVFIVCISCALNPRVKSYTQMQSQITRPILYRVAHTRNMYIFAVARCSCLESTNTILVHVYSALPLHCFRNRESHLESKRLDKTRETSFVNRGMKSKRWLWLFWPCVVVYWISMIIFQSKVFTRKSESFKNST